MMPMKPGQVVRRGPCKPTPSKMQAGPSDAAPCPANDNPSPDRVLVGGLVVVAVCLVAVVGLMVALVVGL